MSRLKGARMGCWWKREEGEEYTGIVSKAWLVIKLLAIWGILLAIYLLVEQRLQRGVTPCSISETVNCEAVISGSLARTLGVATPLYGLLGYLIIFWAASKRRVGILLATVIFGLVFCLRLAYIELFLLKVICPVCIACQVIMIVIFGLSVAIFAKARKKQE